MRLLVVEDEVYLLDILKKRLTKEHYSVDTCEDGLEAWDYIKLTQYDGIVLDIMLPGMDGIELLKQMRKEGDHTPVLLLTARDSIEDRVTGLDIGADDYLIKPFAFEELLARIRVMLRRQDTVQPQDEVYRLADLSVDCKSHAVTRGGKQIELSSKEFALLEYLIRNQGVVLSREQIEQHIWSYDYMGSSNMVDVYIRYLRKKIDDGQEKKLIQTVRGAGYVLRES
ncbi:MAG TPA: response regulator transcription factor [Candidatus Dorea gallistercoris]|uniref:Stage 0 sporulation protein A homolog n=1 Tax=Candidatus Dorea gallistercoris TaxID=2838542 RepID=A0A9D1RDG8_9FIRM|nr:response regulator transcription factor [Candidatus Dorea gallistercoris]